MNETALKVEQWPIDRLIEYVRNPRKNDSVVDQMAAAIREFGFRVPICAKSDGTIVDGHLRLKAARKLGLTEVPVALADELTDAQVKAFRLLANRSANWAEWDNDLLKLEFVDLGELGFDLSLTGFGELELTALMADKTEGLTDPDDAPPLPEHPVSQPGDLWLLGRHRLLCGDSTVATDVERVLGGVEPDCIISDPPYCSGGFQESSKFIGSIGSAGKKHRAGAVFAGGIANDKLSTRGHFALLKEAFSLGNAPLLYVFTDWRMWISVFDMASTCGYVVRSMIVWDKGSGGMGAGWRTQHELILFGARTKVNFDGTKSLGNVISAKRTGNPLHPTQKPVEIISAILSVTDMAKIIYDPFMGSGTTAIAAEQEGRQCNGLELSPAFVDVTVKRWQDFTGKQATLDGDGRAFDEITAQRQPQPAAA